MEPVLVLTGTFSGSLAKCLPSHAWVSSAFLPPRPDSFVVKRDTALVLKRMVYSRKVHRLSKQINWIPIKLRQLPAWVGYLTEYLYRKYNCVKSHYIYT